MILCICYVSVTFDERIQVDSCEGFGLRCQTRLALHGSPLCLALGRAVGAGLGLGRAGLGWGFGLGCF